MKKGSIVVIFLIFGIITGCSSQTPQTFLFDAATLKRNKERLRQGDEELKVALDVLIRKSNRQLQIKPRSVIEKTKLPPSGDKHDYVSLAGYYWPDPSKPDGLPYIRIDGKQNPETRKARDRVYLKELGNAAEILGLTYYYTQEEKYAEHLARLLKVWFLDNKTKMNPNLKYAAGKPGIQDGGPAGTIHARFLVKIVEAVQLIADSEAWTNEDHKALKDWFKAYLNWMLNSNMGKKASKLKNNIGTAYDMQVLAYALFTDSRSIAKKILKENIPQRMESQFTKEGKQPFELNRADAWIYSCTNLKYWFNIARYAELMGTDLWNYETSSGKSIKKNYEWMRPYSEKQKKWNYGKASKRSSVSSTSFYILERRAAARYGGRKTLNSQSNRQMAADRSSSYEQMAADKIPSLKNRRIVIMALTN